MFFHLLWHPLTSLKVLLSRKHIYTCISYIHIISENLIFLRIHEVNRESTADNVLLIFLLITFRKISSPDWQDCMGEWYLRCVECLFVVSFLSFFLYFIHNIFLGYRRCSSIWCWSSSLLLNKMVIKQFAKIPLLICKLFHDLLYLLFFFCLIFHLLSAKLLFLINFTCIV